MMDGIIPGRLLGNCGGLRGGSVQRYVHPEPGNVIVFGKRGFADVVKDFKVSLFWINPVGPKSNGKCLYKKRIRQKRKKPRREGHEKRETEVGVMRPQPRNT